MLKLGLQNKRQAEKPIRPGIITDNLWLRHSYNNGRSQFVGEGCVTLDGSADYMYWADLTDFDGEDALTFSMWIKLADTNIQPLITKGVYNTSGDAFVWQYDPGTSSGQMQFSIGNNVTGTLNNCNLTTDGTKWHHVAVTYDNDSDEIYFFLDGVRTAATTSGSFVSIPNVSEVMGLGINSSASEMFCGSICQVNIWKGTPVKTETEMQKIMWKSYDQFTDADKVGLWGNFPMHEWVDYGTDYVDNVHNSTDSHTSTDNINQASIVRKNLLNSSGVRVDRKYAVDAPPIPRAFDLSGNNNHGKLYSGRAMEFHRPRLEYITTNYRLDSNGFTNNFTIACWAKFTNLSYTSTLFGITDDGNNNLLVQTKSDGKIYVHDDIDGVAEDRYGVYVDLNTWYRVVLVLDNLQPILYINGVSLRVTGNTWALLPVSDGVDSFESTLCIAQTGLGGPGTRPFYGQMSDFQLWDTVWDAKDVVYDYNNPEKLITDRNASSSSSSNLKLWYPMNDGHMPVPTIFDASGNDNDGTLNFAITGDEILSANNQGFESSNITTDGSAGNWKTDWETGGNDFTSTAQRSTTLAQAGTYSLKVSHDGSDSQIMSIALLNVPNLTVGAEYVFTSKGRFISGTNPVTALNTYVYDDVSGAPTNSLGSTILNSTADTWQDHSITFIATTTTVWLALVNIKAPNAAHESYWDTLSLKPTGFVTGWSNADQQPDIPQTLLQSYNEFLSPGMGLSEVTISDHDDLSFGDASSDVELTFAAWIYINGSSQTAAIFDKSEEYLFGIYTNKLILYLYDQYAGSFVHGNLIRTADVALAGNKWYHVAATYNGSDTITLYVNGAVVASTQSTSSYTAMHNTSNNLQIYGHSSNIANGDTQKSIVAEAGIYKSRELSATQISTLYNGGRPISMVGIFNSLSDISLRCYWRNSGNRTWTDLTGNGRDGTPTDVYNTSLRLVNSKSDSRDVNDFFLNSNRTTNSLNFPGGASYGYVEIPEKTYDVDGSATTFSFWVKLYSNQMASDASADDTAIFGGDANDGYKSIYFNSALTRLTIEGDTNSNLAYRDFSALSYETWYNFVIVCDGSGNVTMYKDGVTLGTMDDGTIGVNMTIKYIGRQASTREMHGQLDDVMIYNSALSADDVKRNYNAQVSSHK